MPPRSASPNPALKKEGKDDSKQKAEEEVKNAAQDAPKAASSGTFFTKKNILVAAVLGAVVLIFVQVLGDKSKVKEYTEAAINYVESQGENAMYVYLLFTLVGVVALIPTTPMEFAGGFLFSPKWGMWTTLAMTSGTKLIANVISVLLARYVFKDWVMKNMVAKSDLLKMVSNAVKEEPWKMAFLVRGSMIPLAAKNYGLGVMEIPLLPIAANSCIFTTFYAFQNIYLGSVCQDIKEVFNPKKPSADAGGWMGTMKSMLPVVFNVMLVLFLVKAVKAQIKKAKDQISANAETKQGKKDE